MSRFSKLRKNLEEIKGMIKEQDDEEAEWWADAITSLLLNRIGDIDDELKAIGFDAGVDLYDGDRQKGQDMGLDVAGVLRKEVMKDEEWQGLYGTVKAVIARVLTSKW